MIENEMVGWHHQLNGNKTEQAPGVSDGQGSLACCSSWGCKELDTTEGLNWTELNWSRTHKEGWLLKNWCFWIVVLEKTLKVPWAVKRSNQSILKKINPEYSLERLMAEAEVPTLWPPNTMSWLIGKEPDAGKDRRQMEKGQQRMTQLRQHHQLNGHGFGQTPGDSGGQRNLICCNPRGH